MKPNFKSYNATSLGFYTTLALTDGLISEIQNISPPDEDGDSLFVDSYKGHWAFVWIKEVDKGLDKGTRGFRVEFNYELGRGGEHTRASLESGGLLMCSLQLRKRWILIVESLLSSEGD